MSANDLPPIEKSLAALQVAAIQADEELQSQYQRIRSHIELTLEKVASAVLEEREACLAIIEAKLLDYEEREQGWFALTRVAEVIRERGRTFPRIDPLPPTPFDA